jgi:hypothetical protein
MAAVKITKKEEKAEARKILSEKRLIEVHREYKSAPDRINDPSRAYDRYYTKILVEKITGGIPATREIIRSWIVARTGHDDNLTDQLVAEMEAKLDETRAAQKKFSIPSEVTAKVDEAVADREEKSWCTFLCDMDYGLYLEARCVKAMFKECASLEDMFDCRRGTKQLMQHGTFLVRSPKGKHDRIFLGFNKPSGTEERPIHIKNGPMGPRTAIKKVDYVLGATMEFEVWVPRFISPSEIKYIRECDIEDLLTLARFNGIGSDRSQGSGQFLVLEFSKLPWTDSDIIGTEEQIRKMTAEIKASMAAHELAERAAKAEAKAAKAAAKAAADSDDDE